MISIKTMVILPIIGGIIGYMGGEWVSYRGIISMKIATINMMIALIMWVGYEGNSMEYEYVEDYGSIFKSGLGHMVMGVDGTSMLLIILTTFLTIPILLTPPTPSISGEERRVRNYRITIMLLEGLMVAYIGVLDTILKEVLCGLLLIPLILILVMISGIWEDKLGKIILISILIFILKVLYINGVLDIHFMRIGIEMINGWEYIKEIVWEGIVEKIRGNYKFIRGWGLLIGIISMLLITEGNVLYEIYKKRGGLKKGGGNEKKDWEPKKKWLINIYIITIIGIIGLGLWTSGIIIYFIINMIYVKIWLEVIKKEGKGITELLKRMIIGIIIIISLWLWSVMWTDIDTTGLIRFVGGLTTWILLKSVIEWRISYNEIKKNVKFYFGYLWAVVFMKIIGSIMGAIGIKGGWWWGVVLVIGILVGYKSGKEGRISKIWEKINKDYMINIVLINNLLYIDYISLGLGGFKIEGREMMISARESLMLLLFLVGVIRMFETWKKKGERITWEELRKGVVWGISTIYVISIAISVGYILDPSILNELDRLKINNGDGVGTFYMEMRGGLEGILEDENVLCKEGEGDKGEEVGKGEEKKEEKEEEDKVRDQLGDTDYGGGGGGDGLSKSLGAGSKITEGGLKALGDRIGADLSKPLVEGIIELGGKVADTMGTEIEVVKEISPKETPISGSQEIQEKLSEAAEKAKESENNTSGGSSGSSSGSSSGGSSGSSSGSSSGAGSSGSSSGSSSGGTSGGGSDKKG